MADPLSDDVILSVLNRIEQDQKFFDQMHVGMKQIGAVITRYRDVQANLPRLETEEARLKGSIAAIATDIERQRRSGLGEIQAEFDALRDSLKAGVVPLKTAFDNASQRAKDAEAKATQVEQACAARCKVAEEKAQAAEQRRTDAEAALKKILDRLAGG